MPVIHKTPIPPPKRENVQPPTLTAEQEGKYAFVLNHFTKEGYVLPGVEEEDKKVLMEEERFFLTKECMLRYLRATKWDEKAAVKRLEASLKWRREFGLYDQMTAEYVEPEGVTGKELLFGYDTTGRPALYMLPSRQNTDASTTEKQRHQLQYAVWMMERGFDLAPVGVESLVLMIDFADRGKNPSMSTSRLMLSYMQDHYPERLGRALITNIPYFVNLFFKVIMPFVDPVTREKVKFNPNVIKDGYFTTDQCTTAWGGEVEIPFEHPVYWPALLKLAGDRRQKRFAKWKALGATIGLSEYDYKQDEETEVETEIVIEIGKEQEKVEVVKEEKVTTENQKTPEVPAIPRREVTSVAA